MNRTVYVIRAPVAFGELSGLNVGATYIEPHSLDPGIQLGDWF